ncbi:MAG: peptide deformylase [Phycisphaera sp.]|nr:peptide deformylase [Phycisphaera sp.]
MPVNIEQLRIVLYPDPVLRNKASELRGVTHEVCAVAQRMLQLMHEAPGVGLAAPQVGLPWRMFVANARQDGDSEDLVFINPRLIDPSREVGDYEEGCLSLPGINANIRRPLGITIEATDLEGKTFRMTSQTLSARIWQHEYDHLDGVLILDRMTPLDKRANQRLIRELEAGG